jgi:hypothetical protein
MSLLVARWRKMAEIREGLARVRREAGEITTAIAHSSAADGYTRCSDELLTFMEGKTPPPVGEQWEDAERKF